jgi:amino acid transporter
MAWSRLLVALSQDGWLPATFSRRSRRTGAPISALLVGALFCAAVAGLGLRRLVEIDVLLYGAGLTLEFVALVVLRLREPDLPRPFRVPGGLAGAVALGLAPTLLLAAAAWQARDEPGMAGLTAVQLAGLAAVAGPIWYLARGRAATAAEPGER